MKIFLFWLKCLPPKLHSAPLMHQRRLTALSALISCVALVGAAVLVCKMLEVLFFCRNENVVNSPSPHRHTHTHLSFPRNVIPRWGSTMQRSATDGRVKGYSCHPLRHPLHPGGEGIAEPHLGANTSISQLQLSGSLVETVETTAFPAPWDIFTAAELMHYRNKTQSSQLTLLLDSTLKVTWNTLAFYNAANFFTQTPWEHVDVRNASVVLYTSLAS